MFSESGLAKSLSFKLVDELKISPSSLTMFNYEEGNIFLRQDFVL